MKHKFLIDMRLLDVLSIATKLVGQQIKIKFKTKRVWSCHHSLFEKTKK